MLPQPGEGAAHRRLAEAESLARPRHVAVFEQRAKHGQKVKVDARRARHRVSLQIQLRFRSKRTNSGLFAFNGIIDLMIRA
jgi:hypothetical protein